MALPKKGPKTGLNVNRRHMLRRLKKTGVSTWWKCVAKTGARCGWLRQWQDGGSCILQAHCAPTWLRRWYDEIADEGRALQCNDASMQLRRLLCALHVADGAQIDHHAPVPCDGIIDPQNLLVCRNVVVWWYKWSSCWLMRAPRERIRCPWWPKWRLVWTSSEVMACLHNHSTP